MRAKKKKEGGKAIEGDRASEEQVREAALKHARERAVKREGKVEPDRRGSRARSKERGKKHSRERRSRDRKSKRSREREKSRERRADRERARRERRGNKRSKRRAHSSSDSSEESASSGELEQREQQRVREETAARRRLVKERENLVRKKLEQAGVDELQLAGAAEDVLNKWAQDGFKDLNTTRRRNGRTITVEEDNEKALEERQHKREAALKEADKLGWDHWVNTSLEESKQQKAEENRRRKIIGLPSLEEIAERQAQKIAGLMQEDSEDDDERAAVTWKAKDLSIMYKKKTSRGTLVRAGGFRPPGHTDSEASASGGEEPAPLPEDVKWQKGVALDTVKKALEVRRRTPSSSEDSDSSASVRKKKKKNKKSKGKKKKKH